MITIKNSENISLRDADYERWKPLANLILLCIPSVLICQFITIGLQLLRGDYGIFFERRLYLYALCIASVLYIVWKLLTSIIKNLDEQKITKQKRRQNIQNHPNKPQVPETRRRKDSQYWRQFFKPYIVCLPGFIVGQIIFIALALIEKNFDFCSNYVHQSFLATLLLIVLIYSILHYVSTKHQRSHQTVKESRDNFFKEVANFILTSIPGVIVGILLQVVNLESFAILHNLGQQILVSCLFLIYLAFKIFQYRCWKFEEITHEKIVSKINNLSEIVAFNQSYKLNLIQNEQFIENLYMLYQIIYSNHSEVEYLSDCKTFNLEDFYRFLKIIECHQDFSFETKKYLPQLKIIIFNLRTQEKETRKVVGKERNSEKLLKLVNRKTDIKNLLEIILSATHDQLILKTNPIVEPEVEVQSIEMIVRNSSALRTNG